eukprot:TRINITY_DN2227_c0_g4_i1.p1 TRINITY_DN2227_c0_g4~~TRINITY_DN2227_c0_g4_i1.p1  ORF type:complete len:149 (+),score=17.73 TRINITY_DN2227_c0_g4_i1:30-449(+)
MHGYLHEVFGGTSIAAMKNHRAVYCDLSNAYLEVKSTPQASRPSYRWKCTELTFQEITPITGCAFCSHCDTGETDFTISTPGGNKTINFYGLIVLYKNSIGNEKTLPLGTPSQQDLLLWKKALLESGAHLKEGPAPNPF